MEAGKDKLSSDPIIRLEKYKLLPAGKGNGIAAADFSVYPGEAWSVASDQPADAHLFMRALATLCAPAGGDYFYGGVRLDFADYRRLLPFKKRIGYISPETVLISNRTIRDNLYLIRSYFENASPGDPFPEMERLCRVFHIEDKLELRPSGLDREDLRMALVVRELVKNPEVLLIERPRDFLGLKRFGLFSSVLKEKVGTGLPLVFLSSDEGFNREFSNREALIEKGKLRTS
ncbi:MAG: hypothetical protein PHG91_03145 [Syntrophales bacterium]|nr:hypothetical protein [Syntrophales bacterium]MDD5232370.1 hypothetical protein [Syntrophales bacterium]